SHELKTPLAGLLTQAQVAMKTSDEGMRQQALGRIEQAVKRMTNMVQQLLTFSRIESDPTYLNKQYVELSREVIQIIAELEPEAHKKQISMSFEHNSVAYVKVNVPLIGILIRNILDNAVKYTPRGGKIVISLTQRQALELCVEDSGPGIAIEQYDDAYKRFYRCIETANKVQGTGLGLSMVQRISLLHDAELHMDKSRFGGLKLAVLFPLLPEANPVKNIKNVKKQLFGNIID
ncbi:MAG: ATP-binding protein, partial [Methylicorpusculum sp.]|nr:ATP-binding protein [Methylicorpusculum sp.]